MKNVILTFMILFGGFVFPCNAQVVITEFMADPSKVADNVGEWIELFNIGTSSVDLNGWTLKDNGSNIHIINNGAPLVILSGSYIVLGMNSDFNSNGGLTVDYVYSNFTLANTGDAIILVDKTGTIVDEVNYSSTVTGRSWNLDPAHYSTLDNNNFNYWCNATSVYGLGDYGNPRVANTSCNLTSIESSSFSQSDFSFLIRQNILYIYLLGDEKYKSWIIIDLTGKIIASGNTSKQDELAIDLNSLPRGTYLFGFKNRKPYKKFIVR